MPVPEDPYKPVGEAEQLQHEGNTGKSQCWKRHEAQVRPFVSQVVSGWLACAGGAHCKIKPILVLMPSITLLKSLQLLTGATFAR